MQLLDRSFACLSLTLLSAACLTNESEPVGESLIVEYPEVVIEHYSAQRPIVEIRRPTLSDAVWNEFANAAEKYEIPAASIVEYRDVVVNALQDDLAGLGSSAPFLRVPADMTGVSGQADLAVQPTITAIRIANAVEANKASGILDRIGVGKSGKSKIRYILVETQATLLKGGFKEGVGTGLGDGKFTLEQVGAIAGQATTKSPTEAASPNPSDPGGLSGPGGLTVSGSEDKEGTEEFTLAGPLTRGTLASAKDCWSKMWVAHAERLPAVVTAGE
ncbi:MAG: hypothetical protein AAGB93_00505 [Planctomycetota bacterium]